MNGTIFFKQIDRFYSSRFQCRRSDFCFYKILYSENEVIIINRNPRLKNQIIKERFRLENKSEINSDWAGPVKSENHDCEHGMSSNFPRLMFTREAQYNSTEFFKY